MNRVFSTTAAAAGLMSISALAVAAAPNTSPPQEPAGFVTGAVIGGFAAGPVGAILGAGLGTWLGNRVHHAAEATRAQADAAQARAQVALLQADKSQLESRAAALEGARSDLTESNRALTARLDDLAHREDGAEASRDDAARERAARLLDGLQGEVMFRTGSAEIPEDMAHEIGLLGAAVAQSAALKVRIDGFADPRGTLEGNLKLSEARADAVRDLMLAAGVGEHALEINAYGDSQSVAADRDGYAFERRVRLTLQAADTESARAADPAPKPDATPATAPATTVATTAAIRSAP
jgi:outer membrane protein OmpA-like peptidoglycan-associated protein